MQYGIITVIIIISVIVVIHVYEIKSFRKKLRMRLRLEYGQKPFAAHESADDKERAVYYNLMRHVLPEDEQVDGITWEDLELGKVFGRVNTTVSCAGEQLLFAWLHWLPKDKDILTEREKQIRFFDEQQEKREEAQLLLYSLRKEAVNYYLPEFVGQLEFQRMPFLLVCKLLSGTLAVCILCAVLTGMVQIGALAGLHLLVNLAVYVFFKAKYEVQMESLYGIIRVVKAADGIFPLCREAMEKKRAKKITECLNKLKGISGIILLLEQKRQARLSGDAVALMGDYLLGAFMWDFILYDKVIGLLSQNSESFLTLYRFDGEMDACISVASFRKSLESFCIPEFGDERVLRAEKIYHPLLTHAVKNDFELKKNIVITGSNASGKSTFIKAVAVNLILGQSIYTCTAERLAMPDALVLTSMAVRDDVLSGESYYIREVRYLKRMVLQANGGRLVFCGIDEILRGTNTMERIAASVSLLKYMNKKNCVLMVASHDLELAEAVDGLYENYYFCESVQEDDILFDYKLHRGISYTRNAVRLLKSMGFPEEIVSGAQERCMKG